MIKLKHKYLNKFRKTKTHFWKSKYRTLRLNLKLKIGLAHQAYISDVQQSLSVNPKYFWSYFKSQKEHIDILDNMSYGGLSYKGSESVASAFATYFSSVFVPDDCVNCNCIESKSYFCYRPIKREEIKNAIDKIKGNRAIGPDGVPSYIIKGCRDYLLEPLEIIFNCSLKSGVYPKKWKLSKVIPVHKNGPRNEIMNYRPISIVSALSKVLEVVLFNRIYDVVSSQISPNQHGFLPQRSTLTNLLIFSQYIHESLKNKRQVDVIYTDMEKAFDRVRHCIILRALSKLNVPNILINNICSYLAGREQFVEIKGHKSKFYKSTSGVPQGSNLGPLLFLVAINGIIYCVKNARALIFADDLKIFLNIDSVNDCLKLQEDFMNIIDWCNENNFNLNVGKCSCMSFSLNRNMIEFQYEVNDAQLKRVNLQRDLGIIFDTGMSFAEHIQNKILEAQKVMGFIIRSTRSFNVDVALRLFDALVLPKLEYNSIIWSPLYDVYVNSIEGVQRKFLKYVFYKAYGVYPPQGIDHQYLLSIFNRVSLEKRRISICLSALYKLLKGSIDAPDILGQLPFAVHQVNSRNKKTFYLDFPRTNLYKTSPIFTMCKLFNEYASEIDIDTTTLRHFKKVINIKLRTK